MSTFPKITIITPSYNQGEFLEDTIKSVLNENYPNLEYFVIDGGSTDNSVEIIKKYEKQIDWWVSEKDRGQSHALNKGLERATGDIVTWLNSDDFFYPGALHAVAEAYRAYPHAGLFVGNGTIAGRKGERKHRYSKRLAWDYNILLRGANFVLQPSTFLARRVFVEQGFIDEKITYGMDLELWLRVGNKYPVVTIDEELSAFRWYEEVKSVTGGFKEWISMYQMTRRYCNDPITPGLVLEFFKKLQDPQVQSAAGFEGFDKFVEENYWKFYREMQTLLGSQDCIPLLNKGISFFPQDLHLRKSSESPRPPTIDIVLPQGHSWFVREGYVEALRRAGCLGRVFYIPSWAPDDARNQELFDYLPHCKADAIFLMDTLWHAQSVHATAEWKQQWAKCRARKIMFSFECMSNPLLWPHAKWRADNLAAVQNAAACIDAVVHAHEIDESLFRSQGISLVLFQPFAVDPNIFPEPVPFSSRLAQGFFKGKADRFYGDDNCYRDRRALISYLREHAPQVEVVDQYSNNGKSVLQTNQDFIAEMNRYQIVVGLPSLSPTMVVRPFEAMLAGCVFFQNIVEGSRSQKLFQDGVHCIYYDPQNPAELVSKINALLADPVRAAQIAENGRRQVLAHHTIDHRVSEVISWLQSVVAAAPERVVSVPKPAKKSFMRLPKVIGKLLGLNSKNSKHSKHSK